MAEELQHLIDRIRDEAVDKGDQKAQAIISKAKEKAAKIVQDAEKEARSKLEKADREAEMYTRRSQTTLEQSARDLLITVGQGVENILADLVGESLEEALNIKVLEEMIVKIAASHAENPDKDRIDLLISPEDQKQLIKFFAERYKQKMIHGIEIHTDNDILKGFKVSLSEGEVYQDFTKVAIAEALTNFLRPHLSEIVTRVAKQKTDSKSAKDS